MKLTELKNNEYVMIDTDVIIYANQRKSNECIQLLKRCALREIKGIITSSALSDLVKALMLIEAKENNWLDNSDSLQTLMDSPEIVRRMTRYSVQLREFIGIGFKVEPVTMIDILEAVNIQRETGLITEKAILLAVAKRLNCQAIASADGNLEGLPGVLLHSPTDLEN